MRKTILPLLVSSFFSLLYTQDTADLEKQIEKRDNIRLSKYGTNHPAFIAITLNGDTITEKQLIGKVTLINLWFEYCAPWC